MKKIAAVFLLLIFWMAFGQDQRPVLDIMLTNYQYPSMYIF